MNDSTEEKRLGLYNKQKNMLKVLLEHQAITREQYKKSLSGLAEKMNINDPEITRKDNS